MADWLEAAVAADAAEGHRKAKHLALQNLIRECEQQIGGATLNLDGVLSSLADDLPELMEEARPAVARLKGARTASEAITLGGRGVENPCRAAQTVRPDPGSPNGDVGRR